MATEKAIANGISITIAVLLGTIVLNVSMLAYDIGTFMQKRVAIVTKQPSLKGINGIVLTDRSMYNFIDTTKGIEDFRYSEDEPIVDANRELLLNSTNGRWQFRTIFLEDEEIFYIQVEEAP